MESFFGTLKSEFFRLNRFDERRRTEGRHQTVHPLLQSRTHQAQIKRPEPRAVQDSALARLAD